MSCYIYILAQALKNGCVLFMCFLDYILAAVSVEDVLVTLGRTVSLFCNVSGHPNLEYDWTRVIEGVVPQVPFLEPLASRVSGENTRTLQITNVGSRDAQTYRCRVSLLGELIASGDGNLTTQGKPV